MIAVAFLKYVAFMFENKANLSKLSLSGILFILTLLAILGIFSAFFIKVKLVPTLWLLLFISPVVLFISHRALTQADCQIPEYRAAGSSSSKKQKDQ